jgi:hypothetical protein
LFITLIDTVIVVILYVSVWIVTKIQVLNLKEVKKSIKYGGQLCKIEIESKKMPVLLDGFKLKKIAGK